MQPALHPDIYVKGGDYTIETLPETPIVQGYGGEIKLIPVEIATGTTNIIEVILGSAPAAASPDAGDGAFVADASPAKSEC